MPAWLYQADWLGSIGHSTKTFRLHFLSSRAIPNHAIVLVWTGCKRVSIARVEVIVARRKDKLSGCYKSTKGKTRSQKLNFGSIIFLPLVTENVWVWVRLTGQLKKYFRLGLVENICLKRLGKCYFMGSYRKVFHIPWWIHLLFLVLRITKSYVWQPKEERRLAELKKKQQYLKDHKQAILAADHPYQHSNGLKNWKLWYWEWDR